MSLSITLQYSDNKQALLWSRQVLSTNSIVIPKKTSNFLNQHVANLRLGV